MKNSALLLLSDIVSPRLLHGSSQSPLSVKNRFSPRILRRVITPSHSLTRFSNISSAGKERKKKEEDSERIRDEKRIVFSSFLKGAPFQEKFRSRGCLKRAAFLNHAPLWITESLETALENIYSEGIDGQRWSSLIGRHGEKRSANCSPCEDLREGLFRRNIIFRFYQNFDIANFSETLLSFIYTLNTK